MNHSIFLRFQKRTEMASSHWSCSKLRFLRDPICGSNLPCANWICNFKLKRPWISRHDRLNTFNLKCCVCHWFAQCCTEYIIGNSLHVRISAFFLVLTKISLWSPCHKLLKLPDLTHLLIKRHTWIIPSGKESGDKLVKRLISTKQIFLVE